MLCKARASRFVRKVLIYCSLFLFIGEIPKKGGTRTINYLDRQSSLWKLQRELLNKYLVKQDLPICVKGFKKGENYKSFLSEHIGAEFFLRIDIANFFPSIKISSVKRELSLIIRCDNDAEEEKLLDLIGEIVTLDGRMEDCLKEPLHPL